MDDYYANLKIISSMQDSISRATLPSDTLVSICQRTLGIMRPIIPNSESLEIINSSVKSLIKATIGNQFFETNVLTLEAMTNSMLHLQKALRCGINIDANSVSSVKSSLDKFLPIIQSVTICDKYVNIPESIIPVGYIYHDDVNIIENRLQSRSTETPRLKKISAMDAFNIITILITILISLISLLQNNMDSSQKQLNECMEEQLKTNELLHLQLDATKQTVDYLSKILYEIQVNDEHHQGTPQQYFEHPISADFDFQLTGSNPSESQADNPTSPDVADTPNE